MELNLETVQQFLADNKDKDDVKSFVSGFVNDDAVSSYLESENGKKLLQPRLDKYFTKGLETWKNKNLPNEIESAIKERFPAESEEAKKLREMSDKLAKLERDKEYGERKSEALQALSESGLPATLAPYVVGETSEETREKIAVLEREYNSAVEGAVKKRLSEVGKTPPAGDDKDKGTKITQAELLNMSYPDRIKFYKENPEAYKEIMKK